MSARVCVAMSGGVDSSVAALLLKRQGYEVIGISMKLYKADHDAGRKGGCCTPRDMDDARWVAEMLNIPYFLFDYQAQFKSRVIDPFVQDYRQGRTPNPCVRCNQEVKFDILFREAKALGCDFLATGHYARIQIDDQGIPCLYRAHDKQKDQSYFLFGLTADDLRRMIFPLGDLRKDEVRQLAQEAKLPVSAKPDSQEICFVAGGSYVDVVRRHGDAQTRQEGEIRNLQGDVLGHHQGHFYYTIGQRKGLGALGATAKYVLKVLAGENAVVVGDEADLYHNEAELVETRWTRYPKPDEELNVKIRSHGEFLPAYVTITAPDRAKIHFYKHAKSLTPGQAAVCYAGEATLGGGFIR